MAASHIELRGVEVHNLKEIDVDIPHHQLVVFCGVSGSGKTSLALDTLYAEGQRRYIESFSAYTRQFLERLEKPAAERIDGIPPSIAVTQQTPSSSSRANIGTATEVLDYLRLLVARIGKTHCYQCSKIVRRDNADTVVEALGSLGEKSRYMVCFPVSLESVPASSDSDSQPTNGKATSVKATNGKATNGKAANGKPADETTSNPPADSAEDDQNATTPAIVLQELHEDGFVRIISGDQTLRLDDSSGQALEQAGAIEVVVDRLTGSTDVARVRDSLETAFSHGNSQTKGRATVLIQADCVPPDSPLAQRGTIRDVDGKSWLQVNFNQRLVCDDCHIQYPTPNPKLFSFNSPLGACPACEGFGNLVGIDMDLVVPDRGKSLKEGAIAPWNTPAYEHELHELLDLASDYDLPVDVPFRDLEPRHLELIQHGVPERDFGGLDGFFAWLEKRKYKMHLRVFLSRWRSYSPCPECNGGRLRKESLATRIGGLNIAEISQLKIRDAAKFFDDLDLSDHEQRVGQVMLDQIQSRLHYLEAVGLEYLTLDRTLRTLSGGEAQRVALTSALGSSLVNMLYVLDEPSVGLHPLDTDKLLHALFDLRDRGNSVVVVEHEETILQAADHLVEIGPGAGENGGHIMFEGSPGEMLESDESLTGDYLAGRRGVTSPEERRSATHGWIKVSGARGNNLKDITVELPLGVLCVVTGVSGAGKSTLIHDTLYPALCRRKRKDKDSARPLDYDDVFGDGQIDDVVMVDQSPIGRSPRSNPVTYIKAFDAIRNVFAETVEARTHNYSASHFSFNVDGGRCTACNGDGYVQIDMQFLADVFMRCNQCQGTRYRREILDVKYRGKSIADVLEMTVRQAYSFFRGQDKVQARLKRLMDVGLDYLRLGQPANNLSAGEAQRLKLAGYLSTAKRSRTLFLMDEPTTGLHFSDVTKLLDCMDALIASGHSLIVIEHNLQMIKSADYIVDMGPGASDEGGTVVAAGTPEELCENKASHTAQYLKPLLEAQ